MRKGKISALLVVFSLSLAGAGCTLMTSSSLVPNTNFAYPNSNVTPIGPATGMSQGLCGVLGLPLSDPANALAAAQKQALSSTGGDLLIDAKVSHTAANLAVVTLCQTRVSGTAANMTIGKQELR